MHIPNLFRAYRYGHYQSIEERYVHIPEHVIRFVQRIVEMAGTYCTYPNLVSTPPIKMTVLVEKWAKMG